MNTTTTLVEWRDPVERDANLTAELAREEIEEALGSDQPLELCLDLVRPASAAAGAETRTITVAWDRADLEAMMADPGADAVALSFDRGELERVLDRPDFEGHGLRRTAIVLSVAVAAVIGASAASGRPVDQGLGSSRVTVTAVSQHDEATLSERGIQPAPRIDERSSGLDFPTLDESTAGALFVGGGLAVAGLLLVGAEFEARRNRARPRRLEIR